MEKIKILHISETFASGVYTYIKQLKNYSKKNDLKTFIIYSGERSENKDILENDFSIDTELICIQMTREISLLKDIVSLINIIKEVRRIKPDVIHVHSSKAGVLGRIARIFHSKAKLFYTPHGYSFLREDISNKKKKLYKFVESVISKIFGGTIVACGDQEYEEASKIGKAVLIRNGVDVNDFKKFEEHIPNEILTIGTSGNIYEPKNPSFFNELASNLPQYKFMWIGDGELKNRLNSEIVEISGWKSRDDALELVNNFDVFISTSLWEGLPFNIIEAMAMSKPIISSNIKGNRVTISQNKNGFLCNNLEEFIAGIKKLEDKEIRDSFGRKSKNMVDELFDINKNFIQLINLYKSK
jgi:glycosyltransferase involved in cell wall biosynthesis